MMYIRAVLSARLLWVGIFGGGIGWRLNGFMLNYEIVLMYQSIMVSGLEPLKADS